MLRKLYKLFYKLLIGILNIQIIIGISYVPAYASAHYISEITIAKGEKGASKLENKGYNVLFQQMNLVSDTDSHVYLGYKLGSSPITNLIVSTSKEQTISVDGITYNLVSTISLNEGTSGTSIHLYYTKDKNAGFGITSLDTVSGFTSKQSVIPLQNDGSSPVRKNDGTLANLDAGIKNQELYLLMYRQYELKPYISNVISVTAGSKTKSIKEAANQGCDYYLQYQDNTIIGYSRTSNKNNAVSQLTYDNNQISAVKEDNASSYLLDLSASQLFDSDFTMHDWLDVYMSTLKSTSNKTETYLTLSKSNESCKNLLCDSSNKLYAVYLGNVESNNQTQQTQEIQETQETEEMQQTVEETVETPTEVQSDEVTDIEKEDQVEDESTEEETEEENTTASILGNGNIYTIAGLLVFSGIVIIIIVYKQRRGKKHEK